MNRVFAFDVFLSHSSKNKQVVLEIAERLRADGLRVWLDDWIIKAGDSIPAKIAEGLSQSRALVLCMSREATASDWVQFEHQVVHFPDPLNKDRRVIPLRLDDGELKETLAPFKYVSWYVQDRELEYAKLLSACLPEMVSAEIPRESERLPNVIQLREYGDSVYWYAFSKDGKRAVTGSRDAAVRLWDLRSGDCIRLFEGHSRPVEAVAWSFDERRVLSGSDDATVRLWDIETGRCIRTFSEHTKEVWAVAWSPDHCLFASGGGDYTVRLWNLETNRCSGIFEGHTDYVASVEWTHDQTYMLSGSYDKSIRVWRVETGQCVHVLGKESPIFCARWSPDQSKILASDEDGHLQVWDVETEQCLRVLKGHTEWSVFAGWMPNGRNAFSVSGDGSVRLWDVETSRCIKVYEGHNTEVRSVAYDLGSHQLLSGDSKGVVRSWRLPKKLNPDLASASGF